jgi:hypothetical protein
MKKALSLWCLGIGVWAALFLWPGPARATLGGSADSIESDRIMLSAAQGVVTVQGTYTIHTMTSGASTFREYVAPSGVVFALAWDGALTPNLTALLGPYAGEYQQALSATPRQPGMRNRSVIRTARVVVEQWGHMRSMHGRAYVPALVPQGVDLDEIR